MKIPNKKRNNQKTLLVDGDSLLKTAYHGAKNLYYKETHIGGIFQFLTMVRKMLNENKFDRVYVFWDGKFSGRLRYELYKDYKSNRGKDFYNEKPDFSEEPSFCSEDENGDKTPSMARVSSDSLSLFQPVD